MTTRDPLHGEPWRITLAVLAALMVWAFGTNVIAGFAAVETGEVEIGGWK
jgi:hypothetical protein